MKRPLSEREMYYLNAFNRFKDKGQHTWNWSAFCFGPLWMAYRKMYLLSIATTSIFWMLSYFLYWIFREHFFRSIGGFGFLYLIASLAFGYFGNYLYYNLIREKVREGYHKLERYSPTSIPAIFLLDCGVVGFLGLGLIYLSDRFILQKHEEFLSANKDNFSEEQAAKEELNDETLLQYLNPNRRKHTATWITYVFCCFLCIWGYLKGPQIRNPIISINVLSFSGNKLKIVDTKNSSSEKDWTSIEVRTSKESEPATFRYNPKEGALLGSIPVDKKKANNGAEVLQQLADTLKKVDSTSEKLAEKIQDSAQAMKTAELAALPRGNIILRNA